MAVILKKSIPSLIKEIVQTVENPHVIAIMEILCDATPRTVEEISYHTHIHRDGVSKALVLLENMGLVEMIELPRNKIVWKMSTKNILNTMKKRLLKTVENLQQLLEFEKANDGFYVCPKHHCRYNLDEATEKGYRCPTCLEELEYEDNGYIIEKLSEEINKLEKMISEYDTLLSSL